MKPRTDAEAVDGSAVSYASASASASTSATCNNFICTPNLEAVHWSSARARLRSVVLLLASSLAGAREKQFYTITFSWALIGS